MPRPLDPVKAGARDGNPATNKRNVAYHYDVSNASYRLFLDPEMDAKRELLDRARHRPR